MDNNAIELRGECGICFFEEEGECHFNPPPFSAVRGDMWCSHFINYAQESRRRKEAWRRSDEIEEKNR